MVVDDPQIRARARGGVKQPVIWVIDEEQWPRALMRAELIERGYDAVGFLSIRDAIEQLPWRHPDAIIVEPRGQPEPLMEQMQKIGVPVILIERPVSIGEIADRLQTIIAPARDT